jgi:hypothetical protein
MQAVKNLVSSATGSKPQYLTGDKAAIEEFIGKFDVFLFDCDGKPCPLLTKHMCISTTRPPPSHPPPRPP